MATPNTSIRQVFISHATQDAEFTHRLAGDLQRLGIPIWMTPDSILPGEGWVKAIERGLRESSHVVIVLTPAALDSEWVEKETDVAIAQERKGRIKILPLDVRACEVPLLLSSYQMVSFRQNYDAGFAKLVGVLGLSTAPPGVVSPPREAPQPQSVAKSPTRQSQPKAQVARPTTLERRRPFEPEQAHIPAGEILKLFRSPHPVILITIAIFVVALLVGGLGYPTVAMWLASTPIPTSSPIATPNSAVITPDLSLQPSEAITSYITRGTTNITRYAHARQSFVFHGSKLLAIEVYIETLNPGEGDDNVTMKILAKDGTTLAETSQLVHNGFEGWLRFDFSRGGLELVSNQVLFIELVDTGKAIFGWSHERDWYLEGMATFEGSSNDQDFLFRVIQ